MFKLLVPVICFVGALGHLSVPWKRSVPAEPTSVLCSPEKRRECVTGDVDVLGWLGSLGGALHVSTLNSLCTALEESAECDAAFVSRCGTTGLLDEPTFARQALSNFCSSEVRQAMASSAHSECLQHSLMMEAAKHYISRCIQQEASVETIRYEADKSLDPSIGIPLQDLAATQEYVCPSVLSAGECALKEINTLCGAGVRNIMDVLFESTYGAFTAQIPCPQKYTRTEA